ncbi:four-carbon acid sugar kinase family protein [Ancylobacter sonchi]|uniref:3-oxo-tetronate kinase n=1 Tax=Ancylobacter sonchi TaxID=1937790 RepID=UPI001BD22527|nr:3-oxo-tetronate kinase [Ancylobacter sonchi]MBS7535370.1 four-carbon acid sugar kinase family protein [Ancylobacter sonchi]
MLLGVIADDFTGAGDIANTLAKGLPGKDSPNAGGLAVTQYLGVPAHPAAPGVEAGVISLKTRSIPAAEAVAQSLAALDWLKAQGCTQIVFKYCSTFDSTPEGNIGPVGEALAEALGAKGVIACPAFPTVGRSVHQGHLFVHDRLLSESGMQNHPLTPMTDPDIRRWLRRQTRDAVGLVAAPTVRAGARVVRQALEACAARGETLVICDAATDADLVALGAAAAEAALVTGGSGIAIGLPANFIARGQAKGVATVFAGVDGPEAILAGSCSGATRGQIAVHAEAHPVLALDVDAVMDGRIGVTQLTDFIAAHPGEAPLIYSSDDPAEVAALQQRYGREKLSGTLEGLFADTARALVSGGLRRLVVAGGETSGAVAQALGLEALEIGPEIDPGVPILAAPDGGVALALKSGNFGAPDFFAKALAALAGK